MTSLWSQSIGEGVTGCTPTAEPTCVSATIFLWLLDHNSVSMVGCTVNKFTLRNTFSSSAVVLNNCCYHSNMVNPWATGLHHDMTTSPFTPSSIPPFVSRALSCFCGTSVSNSLAIHACRALYLVAPRSKKLVLVLVAHLPPQWVVLCCSFPAVLFVQFTGLCFSGVSLHANQSPEACCLFSFAKLHICRLFGAKLDKKQKNRRGEERQKKGRKTQSLCRRIQVVDFSPQVHVGVGVSPAPLT